MNGFLVAASLGIAAVTGPGFLVTRGEPPPKAFTGKHATLPGKIPATTKALDGGWAHQYQLQDAHLEPGIEGRAFFGSTIFLHEDGTYELHYFVRWNLRSDAPVPSVISSMPSLPSLGSSLLDGFNVTETGKFSLSDEILLLQPQKTQRSELENNELTNPHTLANENRAYLVRIDKKHLHVAGRCASYQIDPICHETTDVWYQLKSQLGSRWLGREPR